MENEIIDITETDSKVAIKSDWLGKIMLKQIQGLPMTDEDWSFYTTMFINAKDEDIERMAKASIVELQKIGYDCKDDLPPDVFWGLKQRDAHLMQNLLKTIKSGRKDDSATRKNNLSTLNRLVKDAKAKGGFTGAEKTFVIDADDMIDRTKEE
jgi:hypothetical protein